MTEQQMTLLRNFFYALSCFFEFRISYPQEISSKKNIMSIHTKPHILPPIPLTLPLLKNQQNQLRKRDFLAAVHKESLKTQ